MTLRLFAGTPPAVPMSTAWHLADLAEAKGRQDLFTRQSPQHGMIPGDFKRPTEVHFLIAAVLHDSAREQSIRRGHPSTLHPRGENV
jgi:hypothetical protein